MIKVDQTTYESLSRYKEKSQIDSEGQNETLQGSEILEQDEYKDLSYSKEEMHQYAKLLEQGDNDSILYEAINKLHNKDKIQQSRTVSETLASFMRSDDDTVIKAKELRPIIEKVLKEVRQESVYVLSNVDNETKTFIVKKIDLPKGSNELMMCKIQYAYLKRLSSLIGYGIMIKDLDREEYIDLEENQIGRTK